MLWFVLFYELTKTRILSECISFYFSLLKRCFGSTRVKSRVSFCQTFSNRLIFHKRVPKFLRSMCWIVKKPGEIIFTSQIMYLVLFRMRTGILPNFDHDLSEKFKNVNVEEGAGEYYWILLWMLVTFIVKSRRRSRMLIILFETIKRFLTISKLLKTTSLKTQKRINYIMQITSFSISWNVDMYS